MGPKIVATLSPKLKKNVEAAMETLKLKERGIVLKFVGVDASPIGSKCNFKHTGNMLRSVGRGADPREQLFDHHATVAIRAPTLGEVR